MPYPELPPEPPPIVQFLMSEGSDHATPLPSTQLTSSIVLPQHYPPLPVQGREAFTGQDLVAAAGDVPALVPPENFPLERSSDSRKASPVVSESSSPRTAELLGNPIEVSLPVHAGDRLLPLAPGLTFVGEVPLAQELPLQPETLEAGNKELKQLFLTQTPQAQEIPAPAVPEQAVPVEVVGTVELTADRQEYDNENQVFTAAGNVVMRFQESVLRADRLRVNLLNRLAVAEGNVSLTRGAQVLQGERFEYNFVRGEGFILNARGEYYAPTAGADFSASPLEGTAGGVPTQSLGDRLAANQPPQQVTSPGGVTINVGAGRDASATGATGELKRIRYEAERIEFTPGGWQAYNIRITNDPYSPPELELRADRAQLTQTSPDESILETSQPRLVFDQGFPLPIWQSRAVIGRRQRDPGFLSIGYDGGDRGGLYVEQTFEPFSSEQLQLSLTPQIFVQKMVQDGNVTNPALYGLRGELNYLLGASTTIRGSAVLTSLDFNQVETNLRASLRARQMIGTHALAVEYSYRDRLFNGSLGFQDVQSSFGAVLTSPIQEIGQTGIRLRYQAGAQYINADTDRSSLLVVGRRNNRVSLSRLQASLEMSKEFLLWQGQGLPPNPEEGLKYSATPVVPYLQLVTGLVGVAGSYGNGDTQETLTGSLALRGQFGNFSRPFFDYTGFNIGYSQTAIAGLSPFLFDRTVDTRVLSGGLIQQIYGPIRVGFQTSINLDTSKEISTDYILEYNRRTYGLTLRYNPVLQIGSLGLRISDFNWLGGTQPFSESGINPVERGIRRLP